MLDACAPFRMIDILDSWRNCHCCDQASAAWSHKFIICTHFQALPI